MNKNELQIHIGKRIKQLREKRGLSQRQLAFTCNKDPQSLERVENGKSCPTVFYISEICQGLGVTLDEFFRDF